MDDQSSDVDALVDALNELLNIQDVQELELASANVEALVDTLNSLDIQESKYASSDVEKLVSYLLHGQNFLQNFSIKCQNISLI